MKVKGLRQFFGGVVGRGWVAEGVRTAPVGSVSAERGLVGAVMAGICAAGILAGGCQRRRLGLGCWWARVTDEAKRRRQELVVCRAALPFEGLIYARSSVTPAPAFFAGAPACWSMTIRL